MKSRAILSLCLLMSLRALAEDYTEINYRKLELSPKDFEYQVVCYTEPYLDFSTTFPAYIQWNNFRSETHLMIVVGSHKIPVLIEKSDEVIEILTTLKDGTKVKVFGKVKPFTVKPTKSMMPHYYVLADKIELKEEAKEESEESEKVTESPPPPKKRRSSFFR